MPFEHGIDHVNVKIFADASGDLDIAPALPVFHRWIRESVRGEELLIDVADYRHVPEGPGVILIGHEANYSLDNRRGRLGLLYARKAPLKGGPAGEKIAQALASALTACRRLSEAPEWEGRLRFNEGEIEITINDRLLAPNTPENFTALKDAAEAALSGFAAEGIEWDIQPAARPGERLAAAIHARSTTYALGHSVTP